MMGKQKVSVKVEIDNFDELTGKVKKYVELLKEAKTLADELASVNFEINSEVKKTFIDLKF